MHVHSYNEWPVLFTKQGCKRPLPGLGSSSTHERSSSLEYKLNWFFLLRLTASWYVDSLPKDSRTFSWLNFQDVLPLIINIMNPRIHSSLFSSSSTPFSEGCPVNVIKFYPRTTLVIHSHRESFFSCVVSSIFMERLLRDYFLESFSWIRYVFQWIRWCFSLGFFLILFNLFLLMLWCPFVMTKWTRDGQEKKGRRSQDAHYTSFLGGYFTKRLRGTGLNLILYSSAKK